MIIESARGRRAGPVVWAVRGLTLAMLVAAIVVGVRKFRTTPEQDELTRYTELTVPAYLREVAEVEERLDRLQRSAGIGPEQARALLVDEVMPLVIRARKHAAQVVAEAESVKASNAEYLEALDRLLEVGRTGVRAIDDPTLSGEAGHRLLRDRRREADEAIRTWMTHLGERCRRAGLRIGTPPGPAERRPG